MAVTTIQTNNKLIQFSREINREFVRENLFSPYMSEGLNAIIRLRMELKSGGEQMNIPLVTKLLADGKSTGTLVGAEEKVDNYGMRVWIDWLRNAVVTNKAESQKDSADIFGEAKPLLSDYVKEKQRDELIQAFMAIPSESAPANLGTDAGQRTNGILWGDSTTAQRDTWLSNNLDRIVFASTLANAYTVAAGVGTVATFASAISVVGSASRITATNVQLLKRRAELCSPKIRPYKTKNGYEYYVLFCGANTFKDLQTDTLINAANRDSRSREGNGMDNNPLFQDGDLMWGGVIIRKVPEITNFLTSAPGGWSTLVSGGVSGRVEPVFLCGQQAAVIAYGQMAKPTFRKEDDYGFVTGTGIELAYGAAKMFKRHAMYVPGTTQLNSAATGNAGGGGLGSLVQWGVVTGFYSALVDG